MADQFFLDNRAGKFDISYFLSRDSERIPRRLRRG
jgi:hypothetical protein